MKKVCPFRTDTSISDGSKKVSVWADKTKHKTQTGLPVGGRSVCVFFGPGAVAAGSIADGGRVGYFRASLTASLGTISSLKT